MVMIYMYIIGAGYINLNLDGIISPKLPILENVVVFQKTKSL